jgi:hypothetical protein
MQEALQILEACGREFGVGAELAHLMSLVRVYTRLTGECSGVGVVLDALEAAIGDMLARAAAFPASSQTAAMFHEDASRLRSYVDRLRALGFHPTPPRSSHEPTADEEQDGPSQGGSPHPSIDEAGMGGSTTLARRPPPSIR